jgi:internalin A
MRRILSLLSLLAIVLLASCSDGGGKTAGGSLSRNTGTVGAEGGSVATGDGSSVAVDPSVLSSPASLTVTVREPVPGEIGEGAVAESKVVELSLPYDALSAPSETPAGEAAGIAVDIPMDSSSSRSAAASGDLLTVYITVEIDGTIIARLAAPAVADESGKTTAFIHNKYLEDDGSIAARNEGDAAPPTLHIRSVIVNQGEQAVALEAGLGGGKLYRVTGFTGGNAEYFDTADSIVSYGGKQALILVHGIDAAAGNFGSFWSTDNIPGNLTPYWNDFLEYFYANNLAEKFDLYGFVYYLGDPIARSGNNLALKIADKLDTYPSAVILGHSVGGLVARSALQDTAGFTSEPDPGVKDEVRGKVSRIITLATPHRGTPLASPEFQAITRADGSTGNWQVAMPANLSELITGTEGGRDLAWDGVMGGAAPADPSVNYIYRLNENTDFDGRIVALGSWDLSGSGHGIFNSLHKLMREAGYENDGVVPDNSSLFRSAPEQSRALRTWSILDYDHSQMKEGKPDSTALLDEVKEELLAAWKLNAVVTFADPNLEACVRERLENPEAILTYPVLEPLTSLSCIERSIVSLDGIESLVNLSYLALWRNQISDLSPLAGLTSLSALDLGNNLISDVAPLSGLTKLTTLSLFYNQISDLSPLSGLTGLSFLSLWHNQIVDVSPLAGMTNLTHLYFDENQVVDISPLAGMTKLTFLEIWGNRIVDISPLADKVNLTFLALFSNQIGDFSPLANLTGLKSLFVGINNATSDISPLSGLTNLECLVVAALNLSDISPVAGMTKLKTLHFYHNNVSDISPLTGLTGLTELNFYGNNVSDLSPLAGLTNLTVLSLNSNEVTDISALSGMTAMTSLSLTANHISNISALSGMTKVSRLYLGSNQISDVSPLAGLSSLTYLNLKYNCITDISPVSFVPELYWEPQNASCGAAPQLARGMVYDSPVESGEVEMERILNEARAQFGGHRPEGR